MNTHTSDGWVGEWGAGSHLLRRGEVSSFVPPPPSPTVSAPKHSGTCSTALGGVEPGPSERDGYTLAPVRARPLELQGHSPALSRQLTGSEVRDVL